MRCRAMSKKTKRKPLKHSEYSRATKALSQALKSSIKSAYSNMGVNEVYGKES